MLLKLTDLYQISLERDFITIFIFKGWLKFFLHKKSISAVRFYIHKPVINLVCRKDKTEKYFSISVARRGVCPEGVAQRGGCPEGGAQRELPRGFTYISQSSIWFVGNTRLKSTSVFRLPREGFAHRGCPERLS